MIPRKLDGFGESNPLAPYGDALFFIPLSIVAGILIWSMNRKSKKRKRKKAPKSIRTKTRSIMAKKLSSGSGRIARVSTLPMRMFRSRKDGEMKLKAEDWVAEQIKLKRLKTKE